MAVEAGDARDALDVPGRTASGDVDDHVDGFGDQRARRRQRHFEDQLLDAQQCAVG